MWSNERISMFREVNYLTYTLEDIQQTLKDFCHLAYK